MSNAGSKADGGRHRAAAPNAGMVQLSPEHYVRVLLHRKWLVLGVFLLVTAGAFLFASRLPDIYSSNTLILVDPQKVPEAYVKSTVTGDVRNRLSTLQTQILSATRLQKIIETLNLYPEERKTLAREDLIMRMRANIVVSVDNNFSGGMDLQAFKITYSGTDPRLVAQVTNQLASLFIEENLKAREQQATGTTEFLGNQLQETRKALEAQEAKLKDFRLKHIGEMPEQEAADLNILGQLTAALQIEGDALNRAEQHKRNLESMISQQAPVVDLDDSTPKVPKGDEKSPQSPQAPKASALSISRGKLAALLAHGYTENHPEVRKIKKQIDLEEAEAKNAASSTQADPVVAAASADPVAPSPAPVLKAAAPVPVNHFNPVVQADLKAIAAEIDKHKEEQQRLSKSVASYRAKLDAIPIREQEITGLVRDYEISKAHYKQLLENQLSAETATQLEIREKGEKFEILDLAQPAERPSSPNRPMIEMGGALGGLALGLVLAVGTEFLGMSITSPQDVTDATGLAVLEVIPIIQTHVDQKQRRKWIVVAAVSTMMVAVLAGGVVLFYHYRGQI